MRRNALVDHGSFALRAGINWSCSYLHTPAVYYIVSWWPYTSIWIDSHWMQAASYSCWFRLYGQCSNVWPRSDFEWLNLQHRGGLRHFCVVAVSQRVAYWMMILASCSIAIPTYLAEVFVGSRTAGVEVKRKMIPKRGGKSRGTW